MPVMPDRVTFLCAGGWSTKLISEIPPCDSEAYVKSSENNNLYGVSCSLGLIYVTGLICVTLCKFRLKVSVFSIATPTQNRLSLHDESAIRMDK